jgi:hypothetical protein
MQIEPPKAEKQLIKLGQIADEINGKFGEAIRLAGESTRSGRAAIIAAIECGKLLNKAKDSVKHGEWQKWLLDNCGNISHDTANKWMGLAKNAHVRNLEDCDSLRKAYIACGLLPCPTSKTKAIGTAEVDIFDSFVSQIVKVCDRIESLTDGIDVRAMPEPRKDEIRTAIAKVKELEGKL